MDATTSTNLATTNLFHIQERIVTRLNFINRTDSAEIPPIVIFQKNMLLEFDQPSVAWKVIKKCGKGDYHTIHYSPDYYLDASDYRGVHSCKMPAQLGQVYELTNNESGEYLDRKGFLINSSLIEFENNLKEKYIDANLYKNNKLIALYPQITPGKKASFALKNNLWVGVADNVEEGKLLEPNVIASIDTELELDGVISADIIMTNDPVSESTYRFHLENIVTN